MFRYHILEISFQCSGNPAFSVFTPAKQTHVWEGKTGTLQLGVGGFNHTRSTSQSPDISVTHVRLQGVRSVPADCSENAIPHPRRHRKAAIVRQASASSRGCCTHQCLLAGRGRGNAAFRQHGTLAINHPAVSLFAASVTLTFPTDLKYPYIFHIHLPSTRAHWACRWSQGALGWGPENTLNVRPGHCGVHTYTWFTTGTQHVTYWDLLKYLDSTQVIIGTNCNLHILNRGWDLNGQQRAMAQCPPNHH